MSPVRDDIYRFRGEVPPPADEFSEAAAGLMEAAILDAIEVLADPRCSGQERLALLRERLLTLMDHIDDARNGR
jgi:hypothetical protein